MEESALDSVDDLALAEAMIRVWGHEAALKASDNACTQTFMGNETGAGKWHRVMVLIAVASKTGAEPAAAPNSETAPMAS